MWRTSYLVPGYIDVQTIAFGGHILSVEFLLIMGIMLSVGARVQESVEIAARTKSNALTYNS